MLRNKTEHTLASANEVASFLHGHYGEITLPVMEVLGSVAAFMALRTFGNGPAGSVLYRTEKALDSVCPFVQVKAVDDALQAGHTSLFEHLFAVRGSEFEEMVSHAFEYVTDHVDKVQSVP